jgi:hypothetical protein
MSEVPVKMLAKTGVQWRNELFGQECSAPVAHICGRNQNYDFRFGVSRSYTSHGVEGHPVSPVKATVQDSTVDSSVKTPFSSSRHRSAIRPVPFSPCWTDHVPMQSIYLGEYFLAGSSLNGSPQVPPCGRSNIFANISGTCSPRYLPESQVPPSRLGLD